MYAKNTKPYAKREVQTERSATIESRDLDALKFASKACDENVPPKRGDFCILLEYFTFSQKNTLIASYGLPTSNYWATINIMFLHTFLKLLQPWISQAI